MQNEARLIHTPYTVRVWTGVFDLGFIIMEGLVAAIPGSLWYNHQHAAQILASGNGGATNGLWAFLVLIVLFPIAGLGFFGFTPGAFPATSPIRLVQRGGGRPTWYQGLIHAIAAPVVLVGLYLLAGPLGVVLGAVAWFIVIPLVDPKHRTIAEWLSGTVMLSVADVTSGRGREFKAEVPWISEKTPKGRKRGGLIVYFATFLVAAVAPFLALLHH